MKLTAILNLFKRPKGNLFSGKNRFVNRVTKNAIKNLKMNFEVEEQNLFYLRHPFLSTEQSHGSTKDLPRRQGEPSCITLSRELRNKKFEKHRRLSDELRHLAVAEGWDFKGGSRM